MKLSSKETIIRSTPEQVFNQIADCNHLRQGIGMAGVPQMSDLQCTDTSCSFQMSGIGKLELSICENTFPRQVVYDVKNEHIKSVRVFFDIEKKGEESSLVATGDLDLPFFMAQMLKPALQNFLNTLAECVRKTVENQ